MLGPITESYLERGAAVMTEKDVIAKNNGLLLQPTAFFEPSAASFITYVFI